MFDSKKIRNQEDADKKRQSEERKLTSHVEFNSSQFLNIFSSKTAGQHVLNNLRNEDDLNQDQTLDAGKMELIVWNKSRTKKIFNFEYVPREVTNIRALENEQSKEKGAIQNDGKINCEVGQVKICMVESALGKRSYQLSFVTNNSSKIQGEKMADGKRFLWENREQTSLFRMTVANQGSSLREKRMSTEEGRFTPFFCQMNFLKK